MLLFYVIHFLSFKYNLNIVNITHKIWAKTPMGPILSQLKESSVIFADTSVFWLSPL